MQCALPFGDDRERIGLGERSLVLESTAGFAGLIPSHVVNHFGEQYRLAHARPAEQSRLAATFERHEHIDDFDPCLKDLGFSESAR